MMEGRIDISRLKRDLIDYYGTASFSGFPVAMMDVIDVESASFEELLEFANKAGFDIRKYYIDELER